MPTPFVGEKQVTFGPYGHILTNCNVWSSDGNWIVYDIRSDPAGSVFDGTRIERVHVETGEVQVLYESKNRACVGVATCSPVDDLVIFIHGPENPAPGWEYSFVNRRGVILDAKKPGVISNLDARDLTPPFTPGALRGGTHLHTFSPDGRRIAFTYEDMLLARFSSPGADHDVNQRAIGVSMAGQPVNIPGNHPGNYSGSHFSVLVTRMSNQPRPGSDDIGKATEEAWIGNRGYLRPDGSRQEHAIAFQGQVVNAQGTSIVEAFVVDLPADLSIAGAAPLEGTDLRRPAPPKGTVQHRLTFTEDRKYPGIQGPRHWLRSSPDGSRIGLLMKDDDGIVQIRTISPNGDALRQLTHNPWSIASAFTWSFDGQWIAHAMDGSIFLTDATTGESHRLTQKSEDPARAPRPDTCVLSPDGSKIAYVKPVALGKESYNQVFVAYALRERPR